MNHFSKVLDTSFEEAIERVSNALRKEGMGILF